MSIIQDHLRPGKPFKKLIWGEDFTFKFAMVWLFIVIPGLYLLIEKPYFAINGKESVIIPSWLMGSFVMGYYLGKREPD